MKVYIYWIVFAVLVQAKHEECECEYKIYFYLTSDAIRIWIVTLEQTELMT